MEKEKSVEKSRPEEPEDPAVRRTLQNAFFRMVFEKGPAYHDEAKEERFGNPETVRRLTRRRVKRAKKPSGPDKPPEAFPGP